MPPKRVAKRALEESNANPSTDAAPTAKRQTRQTTLSFAAVTAPVPEVIAEVIPDVSSETESPKPAAPKKTAAPRKAAPKKPAATKTPKPEKVYADALKSTAKEWDALHKMYKPNPNGWVTSGITADDYSQAMSDKFLPIIRSLSNSPLLAFMLLLDLADHCYGNMEACIKSSGFGDTEEPFKAMDACMVEVIGLLRDGGLVQEADEGFTVEPAVQDVGNEWNELWASLKESKGGRGPNKQERGWLAKARVDDMKTMFERRRERRGGILNGEGDWAGNALNELAETRKRIGGYGIGKHFFKESIKELAGIKGVDVPVYSRYE